MGHSDNKCGLNTHNNNNTKRTVQHLIVWVEFHSRDSERATRIAKYPATNSTVVSANNDIKLCSTFRALFAGTVRHPVALEVLSGVLGWREREGEREGEG